MLKTNRRFTVHVTLGTLAVVANSEGLRYATRYSIWEGSSSYLAVPELSCSAELSLLSPMLDSFLQYIIIPNDVS